MKLRSLLAWVAGSWVGLASGSAQSASQPPPLPGRVYLYSEPDYRGDCLVLEQETALSNLRDQRRPGGKRWDDVIASVRIDGRVRLTLFADPRQRGERLELTRDVRDLRDVPHGRSGLETWDQRASSLKVVSSLPAPPPVSEDVAGRPQFSTARAADRAIRLAYEDILGREADYDGLQLYRKRLLDEAWTEDRLRAQLRNSDEFKRRNPDDVVRRAYRDVLRREPDAEGLAAYRGYVVDRGWTLGELKAELRRSHERNAITATRIVTRAFREVLGRDPDPTGLADYVKKITDQGWSEQRVRESLRASDEFKNKPRD